MFLPSKPPECGRRGAAGHGDRAGTGPAAAGAAAGGAGAVAAAVTVAAGAVGGAGLPAAARSTRRILRGSRSDDINSETV